MINIANIANDDQKSFAFNLMKGYNVISFFTKSEIKYLDEKNCMKKVGLKHLRFFWSVKKVQKG